MKKPLDMQKISNQLQSQGAGTATRAPPTEPLLSVFRYVVSFWGPAAAIVWLIGAAYQCHQTIVDLCRMAIVVGTTEIVFGVVPPHDWSVLWARTAPIIIPPFALLLAWAAIRRRRFDREL